MSEGWEEKAAGHSVDVEPQLPEELGWGVWSTPDLLGDGCPWSKLLFWATKWLPPFPGFLRNGAEVRKEGKKLNYQKKTSPCQESSSRDTIPDLVLVKS